MSERVEPIFWPLVAAALAGWVVAFPLTNTDIWWHLAAGRHLVAHGLPVTDPFSLSARGVEWVNVHWLFQLVAYGVWSVGGVPALVVAKLLAGAAGAGLLVAATPRAARGGAVVLLVTSLFAVRHLVMARPIVVTLVLLAGFFFVLEHHRRGGRARVLWALPLLQILWVNTQGLHALGPVVVAIYLGGTVLGRLLDGDPDEWRPLATALLGCAVASFASPYGAGAARLPWRLLGRIDPAVTNIYALNVSEFVPTWALERGAPGSTWHLTLFLLLAAAAFLLARRRPVWSHLGLVVVFTGLALMANRNLLLLYWLGAPILAATLARGLEWVRPPRWLVPAAVASVAVAVVTAREGRLDAPAPFRVPSASAARLAARQGGNLFCSVRYGGYLTWQLHPRWTPYIDGRLVLRTREQFAEYLELLDDPARFEELRARHRFSAAVLPTAFPGRYRRLVAHLIRDPDWRLLYTDGTEVLLAYEPGGNGATTVDADAVRATILARGSRTELERRVAFRSLARLLLELGDPAGARAALHGFPDDGLLARSHYLDGDLDLAELRAERRLARFRDDVDSLNLLALIAVDRGEPERALAHLRRVLDIDPYDDEARELARRLELAQ